MRHRGGERGYALIVCMWLLVLAGSVAALLIVHTAAGAEAAASNLKTVQAELAAEAAVETARADLLINGDRSRFAGLPASGAVVVRHLQVDLRLIAERDQPNLTAMTEEDLTIALEGEGFSRQQIAVIGSRLSQIQQNGPLTDEQIDGLVRGLGAGICLADRFDGRGQGELAPNGALPARIMLGDRLLTVAQTSGLSVAGRLIHGPPQTAGFLSVDKSYKATC